MCNETIMAKPLYQTALDTQIRELGGRGYNCGVKVTPIQGSYSCIYTFDTPEGVKSIKTANALTLGMVDGNFIIHNGDSGEYSLVTVKKINRAPYKICHVKSLGNSLEEMYWALKLIWPNRLSWQLNIPEMLLSKGEASRFRSANIASNGNCAQYC